MAVAYSRVNFKKRTVQYPRSYLEANDAGGGVTHTPNPGEVVDAGVLPTVENMNQIDKGVYDCAVAINAMLVTLGEIATTLSDYYTRIGNNERSITDIQAVDEQQSGNIAALAQAHNDLSEDEEALETRADAHIANTSNPHGVTKSQVGLGNVPNVATNNQTPTYTEATGNQNLTSGEALSTAMGKLARALKQLWAHLANVSNPHSVNKSQVGLGNVPNVTTNNQTPTYTEATGSDALASGETLAMAFGKLKRDETLLTSHLADTDNPHETDLTQAAQLLFENPWGEPDAVGKFIGNGSGAATLTVNGASVRGQQIDVGFAPSRVVIFIPQGDIPEYLDESMMPSYPLLDMLYGKHLRGSVVISPLHNYYHSGCPSSAKSDPPQTFLARNHGGAVVYGNGFIVQSYNNSDTDSTMYMNVKGRRYVWLAWR